MSDAAITQSLGRLHERMDDLVDAANETGKTVVRIEEKQVAIKESFDAHKIEVKDRHEKDDLHFNSLKKRVISLEKTRDRIKWVGAPFLVGSTSIAAAWEKIMKATGMN